MLSRSLLRGNKSKILFNKSVPSLYQQKRFYVVNLIDVLANDFTEDQKAVGKNVILI